METDVSQDFQEYWAEYKVLEENNGLDNYRDEDEYAAGSCDEGEQEAEWLVSAGLEPLAAPFRAGREIPDYALEPALRLLPRHHADAVRRRVRSLNHTVRQRGRRRQRKPDIREVFRDLENSSTGTRSRSATPDSLDSELPCELPCEDGGPPPWSLFSGNESSQHGSPDALGSPQDQSPPTSHWAARSDPSLSRGSPPTPPPSFVQIFHPANMPTHNGHKQVRRLPSAPPAASHHRHQDISTVLPVHELFRGAFRGSIYGGDIVASDCPEGIEMINYQRIGSMHLPKYRARARLSDSFTDRSAEQTSASSAPNSNSDLTADLSNSGLRRNLLPHASISRSQSSVFDRDAQRDVQRQARRNRSGSQGHVGFEEICRQRDGPVNSPLVSEGLSDSEQQDPDSGRTFMESLSQVDQQKLCPLLLLEVTALFDSCGLSFSKRKPSKRKRKEEGNVFGVSLSSLLERDKQFFGEQTTVPLFVQKIIAQLERRGLTEEGVLRVAAHRLKVETMTAKVEANFYTRPDEAEKILESGSAHEVAALLKKWLRDLPQPLLTPELIVLFYRTHQLPTHLRLRALNLLILLLPPENRGTLRVLLDFLNHVVENQHINKMSLHNVAMIAAPSFFPPRYVESAEKSSLSSQVNLAAVCCQVSETLLRGHKTLWIVPLALIRQVRRLNEQDLQRRHAKENKPMKRLLGRRNASNPSKESLQPNSSFPVGLDSSGCLRVNAPQFGLVDFPIAVTEETTAGRIVLRLVEEMTRQDSTLSKPLMAGKEHKYHERKAHGMYENSGNVGHGRVGGALQWAHANLSCLLATTDPELSLRTHFLYEAGGNIGERQLQHSTKVTAVLKENINASWILRCHHRNGNKPLPRTSSV